MLQSIIATASREERSTQIASRQRISRRRVVQLHRGMWNAGGVLGALFINNGAEAALGLCGEGCGAVIGLRHRVLTVRRC